MKNRILDNFGSIAIVTIIILLLCNAYQASYTTNLKSNYEACKANMEQLKEHVNKEE